MGDGPKREAQAGIDRAAEWAALGEWLASPPPSLHEVDLGAMEERLGFIGRARSALAAMEAQLVGEIARREGDAAAEELLQRDQKRSRRGARKAVKTAAQLEWAPKVAGKLADGAITAEAAGLILDAGDEADVDQRALLAAAEAEPEDRFRRTLKEHINERTSSQELQRRREAQRRRRRASISEQPDGMFGLFAQFDPLTGARVQAALIAKSDELFRSEDSKARPTAPQRSADALAQLICTTTGAGAPAGTELIVLADYDQTHDAITNARLADGTRLTEAETLALACDAKILPGIFNKHTGTPLLGRSQRKVSKRHRKQLIARDRGCIGCAAHHKICEVHHLDHWAHGGETTLDNTCLLCWRCHHIRVHLHGEEITRHPNRHLTHHPRRRPGSIAPGPAGEQFVATKRPAHHQRRQRQRGTLAPRRAGEQLVATKRPAHHQRRQGSNPPRKIPATRRANSQRHHRRQPRRGTRQGTLWPPTTQPAPTPPRSNRRHRQRRPLTPAPAQRAAQFSSRHPPAWNPAEPPLARDALLSLNPPVGNRAPSGREPRCQRTGSAQTQGRGWFRCASGRVRGCLGGATKGSSRRPRVVRENMHGPLREASTAANSSQCPLESEEPPIPRPTPHTRHSSPDTQRRACAAATPCLNHHSPAELYAALTVQ